MNPRIRELARQSGIIQYDSDGKASEVERFAELIVMDCASIVYNNSDDDEQGESLSRLILDSYGVE
jgi:hypothetical protein